MDAIAPSPLQVVAGFALLVALFVAREYRQTLEQIAKEMGQWTVNVSVAPGPAEAEQVRVMERIVELPAEEPVEAEYAVRGNPKDRRAISVDDNGSGIAPTYIVNGSSTPDGNARESDREVNPG